LKGRFARGTSQDSVNHGCAAIFRDANASPVPNLEYSLITC
jgi:hypothetical protein